MWSTRHRERDLSKVTQEGAEEGGAPQLHQLCPPGPQSPVHAHDCAGVSCVSGPDAVPSPLQRQRRRSWDAPWASALGRGQLLRGGQRLRAPHLSTPCIRGHGGWASWGSFPDPRTLQEVISKGNPHQSARGHSAASGPPGPPVSPPGTQVPSRPRPAAGRTNPCCLGPAGGGGFSTGPGTRAGQKARGRALPCGAETPLLGPSRCLRPPAQVGHLVPGLPLSARSGETWGGGRLCSPGGSQLSGGWTFSWGLGPPRAWPGRGSAGGGGGGREAPLALLSASFLAAPTGSLLGPRPPGRPRPSGRASEPAPRDACCAATHTGRSTRAGPHGRSMWAGLRGPWPRTTGHRVG